MLRATWRSLFARKLRLFLSAFAVILGVAFVSGSYVFTDTLGEAFTGLTSGAVGDVIVRPGTSADSGGGFGGGTSGARTVPASLVGELAAVPGAQRADGRVTNFGTFVVGKDGKLIGGSGPPGIAVNYTAGPAANGVPVATLESGRWPGGEGEVVLDEATAKKSGYLVGETLPIVTATEQPRLEARLVGTAAFGGSTLVGASVVMFDTAQAQDLFLQGEDAFSQIWVTAAPGTSQAQLRDAVAAVLPSDTQAATGDDTAARAAGRIDEALSFVTTFLLVFAGIALTVGRLPHRQHLLDPRRPAQPGAGPAPRDRREPPPGGALRAARGGGRGTRGVGPRRRPGRPARGRDQGGLRSVRPRPQQERARARAPHGRRQPRRRACS